MTMEYLFLDTETFSAADLKKVGSYAYAEHPSTEILICSYAADDEPVQVWDCTDGSRMPEDLRKALRQVQRHKAKLVMANGLLFDRLIMRNVWGIEIDPRDILDTMVLAFRHSLPGSLEAQCEVLQVQEDNAKDKKGKALIQRFCKPTPKNYKVRRYDSSTHPQEWADFIRYAKSDISAMREVFYTLPTWGNIEFENTVLAVDQAINDRGFFVDTALAYAAIDAVKQHKVGLQAEAQEKWGGSLTGGDFQMILRKAANPDAPLVDGVLLPEFCHWPVLNCQKSTLADMLADDDLPDEARTLIEMRLGASSTASTKYNPLILGLSADGRRRGCLQYGGASRTLRFAGKGFQPQNLARGYFSGEELDQGIDMLLKGRAHWLYDISKLTASTVRSCIIPEPGKKLVVADYSNVEGRGLAWLAGEEAALDTFRSGLDIYCVTAGKMFGMDPDDIKKNRKDLRQIGKTCELALGYSGGVGAFVNMAKVTGLDLHGMADLMKGSFPDHIWAGAKKGYEYARIQEKNKRGFNGQKAERPSYDLPKNVWLTCDAIKRMWRESHPATVRFWRELEDGAMAAIKNPGQSYWAGDYVRENGDRAIRITRTVKRRNGELLPGWWLKLEMPSGRILSYPGIGISVEREVHAVEGEDFSGQHAPGTLLDDLAGNRDRLRERIRYMGVNQVTRQWGKQYTYSGKLCENLCQAFCRDLLAAALVRVEDAGWPIVLHVHDECVCEVPDTPEYTAKMLEDLMCELPSWAQGFPLAAEGDELMRYAK